MEVFSSLSIRTRICLLAGLCITATVAALIGSALYLSDRSVLMVKQASEQMLQQDAQTYLSEVGRAQARQTQAFFLQATEFGTTLSQQLMLERQNQTARQSSESQIRADIGHALDMHVKANPLPFGVGVALQPAEGDKAFVDKSAEGNERGRFAVYRSTHIPGYTIPEKEIIDDGTTATYWYTCAIERSAVCLTNPYTYTDASGVSTLMATVAVPLRTTGRAEGVMSVDISLASLQSHVTTASRQLYGGYGRVLLVSPDGQVAADSLSADHLGKPLATIDAGVDALLKGEHEADKARIVSQADSIFAVAPFQAPDGTWWTSLVSVPISHLLEPSRVLGQRLDDVSARSMQIQLLLGGCITLAALLLIAWLGHSISRPITRVALALDEIADGDGDLTHRLRHHQNDEIGRLVIAFNRFLDKLQPVIAAVTRSVNDTRATADQAASVAASGLSGMQQQFREIDLVATASQEMTATSHEVAQSAAQAANAVADVDAATQEGLRAISHTSDVIVQLARHLDQAQQDVSGLASSSDEIGGVLEVIRSIAEQTNLLALNAAIEAARAGESGRGFAVVADEVRHLARRTQDSVSEIRVVIEQLQAGTQVVVKAMQRSHAQATSSVEEVRRASKVLDDINGAVAVINDMNLQIASAAEEQSAVSEEVSKTVIAIRDVTKELATHSEHAATIGASLNALANDQQRLMSGFRT
ncbi:TPA: methyl-accepting chemotaxis protein [Pseudomonas putida]|nr:methyl-accepting chemotaxis protein [Pseudomonas putida]MDD2146772.1 methyl-accepting chemotaxis protein [Pseudomonas putida]HDS1705579.1 methyl-accepting chemotaxis protein [Pseudomonas putida]